MAYISNPDTQPGKKGQANFNAVENQGMGEGSVPYYQRGRSEIPMKNVSKAGKDNGILGSKDAAQLDTYKRAGVSSALATKEAAPSSQAYLLGLGLVHNPLIALTYGTYVEELQTNYVNGTVQWFSFTTPSGSSRDVDINPYLNGSQVDLEDVYLKIAVYANMTDASPIAWTSHWTGGGYISSLSGSTIYYVKVFNLESGVLNMVVQDD